MSSFLKNEEQDCTDSINNGSGFDKNMVLKRPYMDFYSLKKTPFTITPDPEFLFFSNTHKTAIENILYGIDAGVGFILLTGEVGTGKTTICRSLLDRLDQRAETVYIINPSLSDIEILQAILDDLGIKYSEKSSKKKLLDNLNKFLLQVTPDKPVVIIIDDAQTMTPEGLENLRLLSNLETDKNKLVQLVLVGQPELHDLLSLPELRQLKQRVSISCQLDLIGSNEIKSYISLRLFVAGDKGQINFSRGALKEIYRASHGIPRLINIICDYALTSGYVSNRMVIQRQDAARAISELKEHSLLEKPNLINLILKPANRLWLVLIMLCLCLLVFIFIRREPKIDSTDSDKKNMKISESVPAPDTAETVTAGSSQDTGDIAADEDINADKTKTTPIPSNDIEMAANIASKKYIVQIASFKTVDLTLRAVKKLKKENINTNWNSVTFLNGKTWYRVYAGRFASKDEANWFMAKYNLAGSTVILAPWTLLITHGETMKSPEEIYTELIEKGYDCTLEKTQNTGYRVVTGAFINNARAQSASKDFIDIGLNAMPVLK